MLGRGGNTTDKLQGETYKQFALGTNTPWQGQSRMASSECGHPGDLCSSHPSVHMLAWPQFALALLSGWALAGPAGLGLWEEVVSCRWILHDQGL